MRRGLHERGVQGYLKRTDACEVFPSVDGADEGEESGEEPEGIDKGGGDGGRHELAELGQEEDRGREEEEARASRRRGAGANRDAEGRDGADGARAMVARVTKGGVVIVRDAQVDSVVDTESDKDVMHTA